MLNNNAIAIMIKEKNPKGFYIVVGFTMMFSADAFFPASVPSLLLSGTSASSFSVDDAELPFFLKSTE